MSKRDPYVMTVLGPVSPESLGLTITHEHLLIDMTQGESGAACLICRTETGAKWTKAEAGGWTQGEAGPGTTASYVGKWQEPLTLENRGDHMRDWFFRGEYRQTSIDVAIYEVERFKRAGGGAIVDATPIGLGRDPAGLRQVSRATGVHIIMGGSYYEKAWHPANMGELTEDEIHRRIMRDIQVGIGDEGLQGGVRPGHIGEVGLSYPIDPNEDKVLRASVRAHLETGLCLQIHPGKDSRGPGAALERLLALGANMSRVIFCHCDSRMLLPYPKGFAEELWRPVAESGAYLEFDCFGWEDTANSGAIDWPNDATRLNWMNEMIAAGYEDRLLMSHDIALKHWLAKFGGWGIHHIPRTVVPVMRRKGFSQQTLEKILLHNPARVLAIAA